MKNLSNQQKIVKKKRNKKLIIISHIANLLTTISIVGLSVLGVIADGILLNTLVICGIIFGVLGVLGYFTNQAIDEESEWE
jgi:FtsH-binding integral membrane protein